MKKQTITQITNFIKRVKCKRCGHEWIPRQEVLVGCPKCKRGYYKARQLKKLRKGSED